MLSKMTNYEQETRSASTCTYRFRACGPSIPASGGVSPTLAAAPEGPEVRPCSGRDPLRWFPLHDLPTPKGL